MHLSKLSAVLQSQSPGIVGMYKQCELVGRVCYHSEDKITAESYKSFIERQIESKHMSPLEAGTVYLKWHAGLCCKETKFFRQNPYSFVVEYYNDVYVTTNYRVIIENDLQQFMEDMWCEPEYMHIPRVCFRMECNIAAYKDFTRHRAISPMVESTRYCNYNKDKFQGLRIIHPSELGVPSTYIDEWLSDVAIMEDIYNKWASRLPAQTASEFLGQMTGATVYLTAYLPDWQLFCNLRYHESTGKVRPECKELATQVYNQLQSYGIK